MTDVIDPHAPVVLRTARLVLRAPRAQDAAFHHALHSDPATFEHAPWAVVSDPVANRVGLQTWLQHWQDEGFGYLVAELDGRAVGVAGVRSLPGSDDLNLYYRFAIGTHGLGLGREAARAVVCWATEWLPGRPVVAVIRPRNVASRRTARCAGLSLAGEHVCPDEPPGLDPSQVWRSPVVRREEPGGALVDDMLDLWCAVNAAGGSVGFLPDSPREAVAQVLERELGRTGDDAPLVTVRDAAEGNLLGFCWWVRDPFVLFAHSVVLKRLMVDPSAQGRNLGALLLCGAHAIARTLPDVDLLRLHYRSGSGLGAFYARHGWVETGRVPGLIRVGAGEHRDGVSMARHPFGEPLVADGRL